MGEIETVWTAFEEAARTAAGKRIADYFAAEPDRLRAMTLEAAGLYLDLSKQPWSGAALQGGVALAGAAGVEAARDRLFGGEAINSSEDRAVLHPALRAPAGAAFSAKGEPI